MFTLPRQFMERSKFMKHKERAVVTLLTLILGVHCPSLCGQHKLGQCNSVWGFCYCLG